MLRKLIIVMMALSIAVPASAGMPERRTPPQPNASALDTDTYVNINKILMFLANDGAFATDLGSQFGKVDGLYFPYTSVADIQSQANNKSVVYASGLWLGAVDSTTGDTLMAIAEYSEEYFPGNMTAGTFDPAGLTNPDYRVYKAWKDRVIGDTIGGGDDYAVWPSAQGAPLDSLGNPAIAGDQMLWTVYNDANPARHTNDAGLTAPMGVEVQTSAFAFNRTDALGNIVFLRFKILNKGNKVLKNMYASLWSDPDLGGASDDLVGCDPGRSLGFCYNATNNDNAYGSQPPAVGYDFFQGPLEFTGDPADTGRAYGLLYPEYRNLPMSSFNKYINGTDPHAYQETYNYMQGLDITGVPLPNGTKFSVPGDPVRGTGELDVNPADRRFMLTTGPFNFRPGDSTEIVAAIIVAQLKDRLASVALLKYYDDIAQSIYDLGFEVPSPPAAPEVAVHNLDKMVILTWNAKSETDNGTFPFEGYTVFQVSDDGSERKRLANLDLTNGVTTIFQDNFDAVELNVFNQPVRFGTDAGLQRSIEITQDAFTGGALSNYTEYQFIVEAYSYAGGGFNPAVYSAATQVTAQPRNVPPGQRLNNALGDTIFVNDSATTSDGFVTVSVVDPTQLSGDDYTVTFENHGTLGPVWHLINTTTGDTLLLNQTNQSGDDAYTIVEGFKAVVSGPVFDFNNFECVANGAGALNPAEGGAFDFGNFPSLRPTANQQVGDGLWGIHTADDGGTNDGGSRGLYPAFFARTTRDGGNTPNIGSFDYEIRFTGSNSNPGVNGGYAYDAFGSSTLTPNFWVPFELWNIGVGTPNNTADDFRMIPWLLDDGNDVFDLSSWGSSGNGGGPNGFEHSVSGGDYDPFSDWIYWYLPTNTTAGEAGYNAVEPSMIANTYDGSAGTGNEVFARMVLTSWNGGSMPPFTQDLPELGSVFRISTTKPNAPSDIYRFSTNPLTLVSGQQELDNIRAVPNPYYLFSGYDNSTYNRVMKFTNLPQECTIRIFTLTGDLVRTLQKNDQETYIEWDVETEARIPIASGLYIYVVDAPGFGQKIGKMAIFTEKEQLTTY